MTADDSREQAIEDAANVLHRQHIISITPAAERILARALADAGLLAGTATTTDAQPLPVCNALARANAEVAKLRAERDAGYERGFVAAWADAQHDIDAIKDREEKLRVEREDLKLRIESMHATNDRAVADLAALRDKVRALADKWTGDMLTYPVAIDEQAQAAWTAVKFCQDELRALLTDGGQS